MECILSFLAWLKSNNVVITNIFVCLSAIFVGYQARLFSLDYNNRNKKEEFENSFKLTNFYITNIIPKMGILLMVFNRLGIDMIIGGKLKGAKIVHFDSEEFEEYFKDVTFVDIEKKIINAPIDVLLECLGDYNCYDEKELRLSYDEYMERFGKDDATTKKHQEIFRRRLVNKVNAMIAEINNGLEYFSMYFNSNLASDNVVYDSLHQTFTDFVKMLYPFMVHRNKRGEFTRKYYTNTKNLYLKWVAKENAKKATAFKMLQNVENKELEDKKV